MSAIHHRSYYFDYLRAFFVLLVVFDHVIHPYTFNFDRFWFITDLDSSYVFDALHLLCYAIMVPGLFFISGVFTPHSLKRRGPLSYLNERILRLGIPFAVGLLVIGSVITYLKQVHNAKWDRGFLDFYTQYYFPDHIAATGFWYLSFLFVFTIGYMLVTMTWKGFGEFLGKFAAWAEERPLAGYLSVVFALSASIVLLEVPFGTWFWWATYLPWIGAVGSLMGVYVILFLLGVAVYEHFGVKNQKLIHFLDKHSLFMLVSSGVSVVLYLFIALYYAREGAFDIRLPIAAYQGKSTWELYTMMGSVPMVNWIRAVLLGVVTLNLLLLSLWSFGKYFNDSYEIPEELAATSYGIYIVHESMVLFGHTLVYGTEIPLIFRVVTIFGVSLLISWALVRHVLWRIPGGRRIV